MQKWTSNVWFNSCSGESSGTQTKAKKSAVVLPYGKQKETYNMYALPVLLSITGFHNSYQDKFIKISMNQLI